MKPDPHDDSMIQHLVPDNRQLKHLPWRCSACGRRFSSEEGGMRHWMDMHCSGINMRKAK